LREELTDLDPWLQLVLVMIYESGKGNSSEWYPYLDILPREFDTLVYWSDSELRELQGSAVLQKIGKASADLVFTESLLELARKNPQLFGEYAPRLASADARVFLLETAHRMATLVMAYAFDLEKDEHGEQADEFGFVSDEEDDPPKGMVPLADMLNADGDKNNVCKNAQRKIGGPCA
jgi:N-lysine methyltransferase SETD6